MENRMEGKFLNCFIGVLLRVNLCKLMQHLDSGPWLYITLAKDDCCKEVM